MGRSSLPSEKPRVLLIDEIDKSDIDLPNDLLNIFEEGEFEITELARIADTIGEVTNHIMFGKSLIFPQEPHPFVPRAHARRGLLHS
jgi:hypothetical protein